MKHRNLALQQHLENEHSISIFSTYLREIVYGGIDGIITTFAVVAGFAGANSTNKLASVGGLAVLVFGIANLLADGLSMGLGSLLSLRSEQKAYLRERKKEEAEINNSTVLEKAETVQILIDNEYAKEDAEAMTELLSKNKQFWIDFMMNYELELPDPRGINPLLNGLITFISFVVFGSVPLIPYILFTKFDMLTGVNTFNLTISFVAIAIFMLAVLRARTTKESFLKCILEIGLISSVAATTAYVVGLLV